MRKSYWGDSDSEVDAADADDDDGRVGIWKAPLPCGTAELNITCSCFWWLGAINKHCINDSEAAIIIIIKIGNGTIYILFSCSFSYNRSIRSKMFERTNQINMNA